MSNKPSCGDSPCFPVPSDGRSEPYPGITYRQWLIGMIASGQPSGLTAGTCAKVCIQAADEIINQLDKQAAFPH